jgi:AcrR family transcriptional regulator
MTVDGLARPNRLGAFGRQNQLGQAMGAKGMQTRRRLLAAVEQLLRCTPLRDLRVAHIVRAAKTSTATFYVYFNDVPEAVLALISEISQSPPSLLAFFGERWSPDTAPARAQEFVACYVEHWQAHASLFRVRNLASDEGDWRFSETRINAVSPLINVMGARIAERQAAGELTSALNPMSGAGVLLALIERIAVMRFGDDAGLGVTRETLMRVAAFFTVMLFGAGRSDSSKQAGGRPVGDEGRAPARNMPPQELPAAGGGAQPAPSRLNHHGQAMGAKGIRTRQRLMEATNELLRSKPLRELSVADIAKRARTSASTFYLYFEDVSDAVLAVIGEVTQSTPRLLALAAGRGDGEGGEDGALAFVQAYIEEWRLHDALFRVRDLAADEGDERYLRARSDSVRGLLLVLSERIAKRQASGDLPADLHPVAAAGALIAMTERIAVTPNIVPDGVITLDTMTRAAALFVGTLTGG